MVKISRVGRLCGDTCSNVCPQTWLNEDRTNTGLSPTKGSLNINDILAYFDILGELPSGLSLTVGFFKTLSFLLSLAGFSGGKERHTSQHPNVLLGLGRPNIRKRIFLGFLHEI